MLRLFGLLEPFCARWGGGGRSVVIGGPLISETKKQTRLLEGIGANTKHTPTIQVTGNVDAVISR